MNTFSALELQAIQAAKTQNWQNATDVNSAILQENPSDINALIRLGVAQVQLDQKAKAKENFQKVLEIDKSNTLAKKHLDRLKNHQGISLSVLPNSEQFIEEPGKTKTVELHRLAGKEQLSSIAIGQGCAFKPKNRYISVEVGKTYVGSLPEDLSYRLTKLITDGNEYECYIRSVSPNSCSVFIKETARSKKNQYVNSFPTNKSAMMTTNEMFDDAVPIEMENVKLNYVSTDEDEEEKALDTFTISDDQPEEAPDEIEA